MREDVLLHQPHRRQTLLRGEFAAPEGDLLGGRGIDTGNTGQNLRRSAVYIDAPEPVRARIDAVGIEHLGPIRGLHVEPAQHLHDVGFFLELDALLEQRLHDVRRRLVEPLGDRACQSLGPLDRERNPPHAGVRLGVPAKARLNIRVETEHGQQVGERARQLRVLRGHKCVLHRNVGALAPAAQRVAQALDPRQFVNAQELSSRPGRDNPRGDLGIQPRHGREHRRARRVHIEFSRLADEQRAIGLFDKSRHRLATVRIGEHDPVLGKVRPAPAKKVITLHAESLHRRLHPAPCDGSRLHPPGRGIGGRSLRLRRVHNTR